MKFILAMALAFPLVVSAGINRDIQTAVGPIILGGEKPFPWGQESPFPWDKIDGYWQSEDLPNLLIQFVTLGPVKAGRSRLAVRILDQEGRPLGKGVGYPDESEKIVVARVQSEENQFLVLVRSYDMPDEAGRTHRVTFLTTRPINGSEADDQHYLIKKVANPVVGR